MVDPTPFRDALSRHDRRAAASWLVAQHADEVLSLCRALVRDEALAEDLTQEAFARAIAGLDGYRAEASPKTWLKTIARNLCIDHLRRERRRPDDVGADEPVDADIGVDDAALPSELLGRREALERALRCLDEKERALIVLRFGHGLGYGELADAFGQRQGAMRMRVSRALATMRAELEATAVPAGVVLGASAGAAPPARRSRMAGGVVAGVAAFFSRGAGSSADAPPPAAPSPQAPPDGRAPAGPPTGAPPPAAAPSPAAPPAPGAAVAGLGPAMLGAASSPANALGAALRALEVPAPASLRQRLRSLLSGLGAQG